jgi:hypothetical protein
MVCALFFLSQSGKPRGATLSFFSERKNLGIWLPKIGCGSGTWSEREGAIADHRPMITKILCPDSIQLLVDINIHDL